MPDVIPIKCVFQSGNPIALGEYAVGDLVPLAFGGTGAADEATARVNLGVPSLTSFNALSVALASHESNQAIHFQIDDTSSLTTSTWSSSYITTKLAGKAALSHTHDDRYYTEGEVTSLIATATQNIGKVAVSAQDTTQSYLETSLVAGQGITITKNNAGADETLTVKSPFYLTPINGRIQPVFLDTQRNKILSISEVTFFWAEAALSNNEWMDIGSASDTLSGHVMPFDGTIIAATIQCENDNRNTQQINLYINDTIAETNLIDTLGVGGDSRNVRVDHNINFSQGDNLRLRAGSGGSIQDTVVQVFVRWRA